MYRSGMKYEVSGAAERTDGVPFQKVAPLELQGSGSGSSEDRLCGIDMPEAGDLDGRS